MNHIELFFYPNYGYIIVWLFYLEDFLKFQYFIPLICCNQVCHRQDFGIIFVSAALSWQSQRVILKIQKKKKEKKNDQVCHIRLCFLPIKWIDLRLHKHVGQYQVSEKKQANCKIRNKPHLKIRYCCNGKNTKLSILQTLYSSLIPSFIVVFKSFKKVSSCFCPLAFCHMHFAATLVYYAHNPRMGNRWFDGKCFLVQLLSQNTYETSYAQ